MGAIILSDGTKLTTIKISELNKAVSMGDDDVFPIVTGGVTEKITRPDALQEAAVKFSQIQGAYVVPIKEENVSDIVKGQALCIKGAVGNRTIVGLADCGDVDKIRFLGLAFSNISQNNPGLCCHRGFLIGVNTTAGTPVNPNSEVWAEGELLFAANTPGGLTKVDPASGRRIKAARTRKGNHLNDDLLILGSENPVWMTAAFGEDLVLRMGDNSGVGKISIRNYNNIQVANFDSYGNLECNKIDAGSF